MDPLFLLNHFFPKKVFLNTALAFAMPLLLAVKLVGQELVVLKDSVVDPSALNFSDAAANFNNNVNGRTYQRHPMTTFKGYQYTTYYDDARHVCLGRRKLPDGPWEIIRFTDYTIDNNDSHNSTTVGICHLDGTIHLAFDHHADPLNYRVSLPGVATDPEGTSWSTASFGAVMNTLGSISVGNNFTYPSFFNAPNGNLMLYYRDGGSGNGDGMLQEYNGTAGEWSSGMGKIISRSGSYTGVVSTNSGSRCPYINGISYAGDRLHASWGWRESANGASNNHDLNYAYSDDDGRTWFNSAGIQIGTIGSGALSINSPGLVVAAIPQNNGLSNQYTHFAYPDGSCHVMLSYHVAGTSIRRYHHHWRTASGTWDFAALPFNGSRPKMVGEDNGHLFLAYTSGGSLRIARGVPNASLSSWTWTSIHVQSNASEGGEGHIDFARWANDNVITTYGQQAGNSAGDPTPLHIRDYQVSTRAIEPVPYHDTCEAVIPSSLGWTAGLEAVTHRVFLGTSESAVTEASPASPEYQGETTETNFAIPSSLSDGITYYWRIDEVSDTSTTRKGKTWAFTTPTLPPPTPDQTLLSLASDASIREFDNVVDVDRNFTLLGTGGPSSARIDRCTIYVFQLPNLGATSNPFSNAVLEFDYYDKDGNLKDCDLYGLGRRSSDEVLEADYYGMSNSPDPTDATLLQSGILDNSTPFGTVATSALGGAALREYLNNEYDSGAGVGEFVFLRLNTAEASTDINRAYLTMSEGGVVSPEIDTRPRLSFAAETTATEEEKWRWQHFGTVIATNDAAPLADPNQDGEPNLLEFATAQNPHAPEKIDQELQLNGNTLSFDFPQSIASQVDGISIEIEWSDTLLPESWSTSGVSQAEVSINSTVVWMNATLEDVESDRRFVRLRVSR